MKKLFTLSLLFSLVLAPALYAADKNTIQHFHGEGEVLSVDPLYSRVTIEHAPIKGFPSGSATDFVVKSADLLKKISTRDLVSFDVDDNHGEAEIVKIERTGQAPPKEEGIPLGKAAEDVLNGAGTVVKTVAAPIAPVGEAATATTSATGQAVSGVDPRVDSDGVASKTKF